MKKSQLSDSWPFNLLKESFGIFAQILIYLKNYSIFEKKRTELCAFSQFKIYPGHGKRVVKSDLRVSLFAFTKELLFLTLQFLTVIFFFSLKTVIFLNGKCQASFDFKRNPRKICWTVLYRRKHKKGQVI